MDSFSKNPGKVSEKDFEKALPELDARLRKLEAKIHDEEDAILDPRMDSAQLEEKLKWFTKTEIAKETRFLVEWIESASDIVKLLLAKKKNNKRLQKIRLDLEERGGKMTLLQTKLADVVKHIEERLRKFQDFESSKSKVFQRLKHMEERFEDLERETESLSSDQKSLLEASANCEKLLEELEAEVERLMAAAEAAKPCGWLMDSVWGLDGFRNRLLLDCRTFAEEVSQSCSEIEPAVEENPLNVSEIGVALETSTPKRPQRQQRQIQATKEREIESRDEILRALRLQSLLLLRMGAVCLISECFCTTDKINGTGTPPKEQCRFPSDCIIHKSQIEDDM